MNRENEMNDNKRHLLYGMGMNTATTSSIQTIDAPVKQKELALILCLSGHAVLEINDQWYPIVKNELAIVPQSAFFRVRNNSDDYTFRQISMPTALFKDYFFDIRNVAVIVASLSDYPVVKFQDEELTNFTTLVNLCHSFAGQQGVYQEKCFLNASLSLIYFICGVIQKQKENAQQVIESLERKDRQYQHFVAFLDLLSQYCCNERNVKFYADKLFMTPQYLTKITNTISGRPALSWINEFVIAEAKQRLKFSGESVQEISYQLNFSDQSSFGKFFKRFTGLSPNMYKYGLAST